MAEVPEVDYTAEEEAAMGGETQPEGENPKCLKPRKGWGSRPYRGEKPRQSPWKQFKQESRDNQAVTTPG